MTNPIRTLIVEDNPADRELITVRLGEVKSVSFEPVYAGQLSHALDVLSHHSIDAVLLDLSLPDSEGIAACLAINNRAPNVPMVVLTGLDDEQMAIEALQCGAQDYLVKGQIDSQLLARSLRYAIERQRIESALKQAHDELEQRVEQRTAELKASNRELQREMAERARAEELARTQQEELAHLARLNTLGEMATSLAHELNQPLTAIVAYTRSCLRRLRSNKPETEEVINELEKASREALRGGEIIKRLRRLVSKRPSTRVPTDINEAVRSVATFVDYGVRHQGFELLLELDESIPIVQADLVQIEQVLLNLVRNAFESMAASNRPHKSVIIRTSPGGAGSIEIHIVDSGEGVDADQLDRLFDPFYTTKQSGLGLGLSISRSIIESHSGKLRLARNDRGGLTATVSIPIGDP